MKNLLLSILLITCSGLSFATANDTILLNTPSLDRGLTVISALRERASVRVFNPTPLTHQDLSDLLWAANGVNRPESGKRTAPSALNAQDIDVYVFKHNGIYVYNAPKHRLEIVTNGDHRSLFFRQPNTPIPPIVLLLVSDISRFTRGDEAQKTEWAAIDAGIVAQNILLFCTSIEMVGIPRVSMNKEHIRALLRLKDSQLPILNIPVSYKTS